jgi:hypothetical protein
MKSGLQFALLSAALLAGPALADDDPPNLRRDLTRALRAEFRYAPAPADQPQAHVPAEIPAASAVIAMPRFTVLSSRINMRELERDIVRNQARAAAQAPKWGCGPLYQKDLGKVRLTVVSLFYIPFAVGFSW